MLKLVGKPNSVSGSCRTAAIYLSTTFRSGLSDLPENLTERAIPILCLISLQVGFTRLPISRSGRCALTAPFHPYPGKCRDGIVSVALSCFPKESGRSCVTGHLALRSSDFPPRFTSERLPDQLQYISSSKLRRISLSFSSQYNIRPQNSQRIRLFPARISTIFWGGTTLEHPPQET